MALLGRGAIAADPTWMAVIVTPGTAANHRVAVLLAQVARPTAAPDQV